MKCFILLALVAVARAGVIAPAVVETGSSVQTRTQDAFGNYAFGYDEGHTTGGTFRRESGNGHGVVSGAYGLRDADGRARIVNYVADAAGFRANVQTNEPGVDPSRDPAAVLINKAGVAVHAPAYAAVAHHGVVAAPAVAHHGVVAAPAVHAPAAVVPAAATYSATVHHAAPVAHAVAAPVAHAVAAPVAHYGAGFHYGGAVAHHGVAAYGAGFAHHGVPAYGGFAHHNKVLF